MYFIMMHNSFSPDYINHCCSKYQKISRKYVQRYIYIFIDSLNEDFNVVVQKKDLGGEGGGEGVGEIRPQNPEYFWGFASRIEAATGHVPTKFFYYGCIFQQICVAAFSWNARM